jgi:hypothetical protein
MSEGELLAFKAAHHILGFVDKRFPTPRIMHELVQVWMQLPETVSGQKRSPYPDVPR